MKPTTGRFHSFEDSRGTWARVYDEHALGPEKFQVSQASVSWNPIEGTLRGLHSLEISAGEWKLVSCVRGRVWDVSVDVNADSESYLSHWAYELDGSRGDWVLIPPGFAHGFVTLTPDVFLTYMMSSPYEPHREVGYRYDDPAFSIPWPVKPSLMSERDRNYQFLEKGLG